jgi:predicted Zn-dependent protease
MLAVAVFALLMQGPAIDSYLDRMGHKLGAAGTVRLVKDDAVRATPLASGNIEISSALFARVQNEAELAGVLAHRIAHMAQKTPCVRYSYAKTENTHDREYERFADRAAVEALIKAGYDPFAMLNFFSRYRHEDTELTRGFSAEDLLIERLQLEATDHPLRDAVVDTPEFARLHAMR